MLTPRIFSDPQAKSTPRFSLEIYQQLLEANFARERVVSAGVATPQPEVERRIPPHRRQHLRGSCNRAGA